MFQALFKGWVGELKTKAAQKILLDSKQYHSFNDVYVQARGRETQIDHIIVSKYGVFVVETKERKGWIFGSEKSAQWTQSLIGGKKVRFQNPLNQNYLHTKSLAENLGIAHSKIHSLVVFWGDCEFKTDMPENVVKGVFEFTDFIRHKKKILFTDEEVAGICVQIRTVKDDTPALQGLRHAQSLKRRFSDSSACPRCGGRLVTRSSKKGKFLGCSGFPRCRYSRELA